MVGAAGKGGRKTKGAEVDRVIEFVLRPFLREKDEERPEGKLEIASLRQFALGAARTGNEPRSLSACTSPSRSLPLVVDGRITPERLAKRAPRRLDKLSPNYEGREMRAAP